MNLITEVIKEMERQDRVNDINLSGVVEILHEADKAYNRALTIPDVICSPILAKIEHINDLGKSTWYEVVYYDDKWYSYSGSKTFEDGEQVVKWKYAKDCI